MTTKTLKKLDPGIAQALEEVLALGHVAYSMGNSKKVEGILTAVRYLSDAIGGFPEALESRLNCLEKLVKEAEFTDWVI